MEFTPEITRGTLGWRGFDLKILNRAMERRNATLASNAQSAEAILQGKKNHWNERNGYDLLTSTVAIYHLRNNRVHVAFDDDPQDNVLFEYDSMLTPDRIGRWNQLPKDTKVIKRQLERAYDTGRAFSTQRIVDEKNGKDSFGTWTSFGNNHIDFKKEDFLDKRVIAFFGDKDVTRRFGNLAFRSVDDIWFYFKGADRCRDELHDSNVLIAMCGIHYAGYCGNAEKPDVVYLTADRYCSDQNGAYGVKH